MIAYTLLITSPSFAITDTRYVMSDPAVTVDLGCSGALQNPMFPPVTPMFKCKDICVY